MLRKGPAAEEDVAAARESEVGLFMFRFSGKHEARSSCVGSCAPLPLVRLVSLNTNHTFVPY